MPAKAAFSIRIRAAMNDKLNLPLSILILVLLILCGTLIYFALNQLSLF